MRILQISPFVPLPADIGGRIGVNGITRSLSKRGHIIHFAAYRKDVDNTWASDQLKQYCKPYILDVQAENNILAALLNVFSCVPYNVSKYQNKKLKSFIQAFFKKNQVDVVHIDHLHMGWILDEIRNCSDVPVCLREHNLEMMIMKRFSETQSGFLLKQFSMIQYKKFLKYEPGLAKKFNKCIMVSPRDETILKEIEPLVNTNVIPVGVDQSQLLYKKKDYEPLSMFHIGPLDWLPNLDGLQWFLDEIFPDIVKKIPNIKFYIYGKDTQRLKIEKNITRNLIIAGYVKDLWAETLNKMLLVVPLRIGGGIRVKIIEMLATGQNIITTSIGKEGIDVKDGETILVADSKVEFINKTFSFFNNEYNHGRMSEMAKELVRSKYTWEKIAEDFENTYLEVTNSKVI